jgi:hypothetical protein
MEANVNVTADSQEALDEEEDQEPAQVQSAYIAVVEIQKIDDETSKLSIFLHNAS